MVQNNSRKYRLVKRLLLSLLIVAAIGGIVIWYIFTERFSDTTDRAAAFNLAAVDLIHEFEAGDSAANAKYAEKIITVTGIISEIESADTTVNLKMADTSTGSYIIFAFQKENQPEAKKVKEGEQVSIKGSCSGGAYSNILETEYITFKRCVISK